MFTTSATVAINTNRQPRLSGFSKWVPGDTELKDGAICLITVVVGGRVDCSLDQLFLGSWRANLDDWVDAYGLNIVGATRLDEQVEVFFKEVFGGEADD